MMIERKPEKQKNIVLIKCHAAAITGSMERQNLQMEQAGKHVAENGIWSMYVMVKHRDGFWTDYYRYVFDKFFERKIWKI